jgi:hypothetical protein
VLRPDIAPRRPFQFTLRTMFIVTTAVAVTLSGLCTPIAGVQALTLLFLSVAVPMILVVALVYGRGYRRTFAIGGLFPAAPGLFWGFVHTLDDLEDGKFFAERQRAPIEILIIAVALLLIILAGLMAVGVRRMIESSERAAPPGNPPKPRAADPAAKEPDRAET